VSSAANVIIHCVSLDEPDDDAAILFALLSAEERARQERFLIPLVRKRFGVCRGKLRLALSSLLKIEPQKIAFDYNPHGKPGLAGRLANQLHFNVSHSESWAVFAFSRFGPVGIDIEIFERRTKFETLVSQILGPVEIAELDKQPMAARDHHIMRTWVAKEALLKAMGLGIGVGMHSIELPIPMVTNQPPNKIDANLLEKIDDDGTCAMTSWIDARAWRIHLLNDIRHGIAALACHPRVQTITFAVNDSAV
jgi:phosphopantetheine--protein transferase-like protein